MKKEIKIKNPEMKEFYEGFREKMQEWIEYEYNRYEYKSKNAGRELSTKLFFNSYKPDWLDKESWDALVKYTENLKKEAKNDEK